MKIFDRVWHANSLATMREKINAYIILAIEHLYDKAINADQMNGNAE